MCQKTKLHAKHDPNSVSSHTWTEDYSSNEQILEIGLASLCEQDKESRQNVTSRGLFY